MAYQVYRAESPVVTEFIILSSGLGGHASFWNYQINVLNKYFHVLTYDQDGCLYNSPLLKEDYSLTDMAQQVLDILNQEKIKQCHFLGHALGGHIGAELAVLMSQENNNDMPQKKLLSLTSLNSWDELDPHTEKCFTTRIALLKFAGIKAYVDAQALFLYPPQWISDNIKTLKNSENAQIQNFPQIENIFSRLDALQKFKISEKHIEALKNTKIHLIANQDDFLVPYHKSFDLKSKLGHGTCSIFESGAHASSITEAEKINESIISFLIHPNYR